MVNAQQTSDGTTQHATSGYVAIAPDPDCTHCNKTCPKCGRVVKSPEPDIHIDWSRYWQEFWQNQKPTWPPPQWPNDTWMHNPGPTCGAGVRFT